MPHTPEHTRTGRRGGGTTSGNKNTEKLRRTFQAGRQKVRGAANVAGQATRAVTQETAGLAREFGRGVTGRGATPAGGGAPGPTQTTAQRLAAKSGQALRSLNPFRGGAPAAAPTAVPSGIAGSADAARAAATQSFEAGAQGGRGARTLRTAGRLAKGTGRLARGLALPGAAIAIGSEALSTTQEEKEAASGIAPVTPLRGTDPTAGGTTAPGTTAPVNLERFGDSALAALRPAVGTVRGAFGFGADAPAPAAQPPVGDNQQQGLQNSFTNADIAGGTANRGTASVEENQAVAGRLEAKGIAERQAGLRAAAQPGVGGAAEGSAAATQLARQASGGGLASAFGALNLSGNQLRREAADRTRGAAANTAAAKVRQKADLDLRNKLTEISATSRADRTKNLAKNAVSLVESVSDAETPEAAANVRSSIFESATAGNAEAQAAAANLVADNIREISGPNTLLGALFNPFDAFFKGERGPLDAISARGQGGFNNEFQNAVGKLVHNRSTGQLQIANPDGSGFQDAGDFDRLNPETREFLNDNGLRVIGEGQEITRGDPARNDPTQPSF